MKNSSETKNKIFNGIFYIIAICLAIFSGNSIEALAWGSDDFFGYTIPPLVVFIVLWKSFTYLYSKCSKKIGFITVTTLTVFLSSIALLIVPLKYIYDFNFDWLFDESTVLKAVLIAFLVSTNKQFEFVTFKHKTIKVLCLILLIFSPLLTNALMDPVMDKVGSYAAKIYRESVSIVTVHDQYVHSSKGNPVGLYMEYTITPNKDIENYSPIDLTSPHGFKLNANPAKYDTEQSPLIIFDAQIDPVPTNQTLLKNQAYKVTLYAVPEYIQDKVSGYREVGNLRIADGKVTNLESVCINEKQRKILMNENETGLYSTEFRSWRPITTNSYSPLNLYQGYVAETVPSCLNTGI